MKIKKTFTALVTAVSLAATMVPATMPLTSVIAHAEEFEEASPAVLSDFANEEDADEAYSSDVSLTDGSDEAVYKYFKFDITSKSFVHMYMTFSDTSKEHVKYVIQVFKDEAMTKKVAESDEFMRETVDSSNDIYQYLKKGTYYVSIKLNNKYTGDFTGQIHYFVNTMPESKFFKVSQKKKGNTVTLSLKNVLGKNLSTVRIHKGKIGASKVNEDYAMGTWSTWEYADNPAAELKESGDKYTYKVKKNGWYTLWIKTSAGNYQKYVHVTSLKK